MLAIASVALAIPFPLGRSGDRPGEIISQRNKKCTSLFALRGSGSAEPGGCDTAGDWECCTRPIRPIPTCWLPVRAFAGVAARSFGHTGIGMPGHGAVRNLTAAYELIARAGLTHSRPPYGISQVMVGNREVEVREEAAHVTPFGTLLHFKKDIEVEQPRVLLVAPLSGHFATLLRGTVRTMLPEHDVYITDWHNMRDVPRSAGRFGFDEYVEHLIKFLEVIGEGAHVLAVCQPCVAVLEAVAVMAQNRESGAAAQHDPDGRADRHPRQSDQGQRARQLQADRMVRAEPDRAGAVPLSPARSARSIRASCSSPPS